ncbi:MAG: nucleotide exchange factor GrpE [Cyanobacteriota bacterium]|nr:nucleotide exchange factor GrpE [Cyanobacteriota bacterium]
MTSEEKQPIPPEDAYPELVEEELTEDGALEELILEEEEAQAPVAAPTESAGAAPTEALSKLQHEAEVLRQQIKDKEENYIRLYADFENFRRRTQREKEELSLREKQKYILEILPVVDNFERAQQQVKLETEREHAIHNSYQSVYRLLVEALKKMGVSRMKAVGQPFDPNLHEAIARQPNNDVPEDTVLVEYQPGYLLGELVVRHAMVTVSAPSDEDSSPPADVPVASSEPSPPVAPEIDSPPPDGDPSPAG